MPKNKNKNKRKSIIGNKTAYNIYYRNLSLAPTNSKLKHAKILLQILKHLIFTNKIVKYFRTKKINGLKKQNKFCLTIRDVNIKHSSLTRILSRDKVPRKKCRLSNTVARFSLLQPVVACRTLFFLLETNDYFLPMDMIR